MKPLDLQYLCKTIGNLSGVPIRILKKDQLLFFYSLVSLPKDPFYIHANEILAIQDHIGYFITEHYSYYGIVNSGDIKLVLGPTKQVDSPVQELKELAFQADVPIDDIDDFVNAMRAIIRLPFNSVLQILCTINYILNGEKKELKDLTIYDAEQDILQDIFQHQQADLHFSALSGDFEDHNIHIHNSLSQEQILLDFVQKGDSQSLSHWISNAPAVRSGVLAQNQLRQIKNTFIVTATLVSRAAIRGGLDAETALALSDSYIQKCELLSTPQQLNNLQYHMVLDYTRQVELLRYKNYTSKLAQDVSDYVHAHLSEAIKTEDIAKTLFLSRPYLSSKFKEETGESLTDFILKEKTEEAKRLLRYTDKPATVIGSYLGFSSQSHFSRVFKKYVGKTPKEYRDNLSISNSTAMPNS